MKRHDADTPSKDERAEKKSSSSSCELPEEPTGALSAKHAHTHPRDAISACLLRVYGARLTTTSGGNVSVLDRATDTLWCTPKGTDKGRIARAEVQWRDPASGAWRSGVAGLQPSTEHGFHAAIYRARPDDVRAVLHAHAPALVAWAVCGRMPPVRCLARGALLGPVAYAPYALPGSPALVASVSAAFASAARPSCVVLGGHGVVVVARSLHAAYGRLEVAETCAAAALRARSLLRAAAAAAPVEELSDAQVDRLWAHVADVRCRCSSCPGDVPATDAEREMRHELAAVVQRAVRQRLFGGWTGTVSARVADDVFLVSPSNTDRADIAPESFVAVRVLDGGARAVFRSGTGDGSVPSVGVFAHAAIYRRHPDVNFVIASDGLPNTMAFAVAGEGAPQLRSEVIPEGYIVLRRPKLLPFEASLEPERLAAAIDTASSPVVVVRHDAAYATGSTWLSAFDRLEVLEAMAEAQINAAAADLPLALISGQDITDIEKAFF